MCRSRRGRLVCGVVARPLKEWQIEAGQNVFELLTEMIVQVGVQTEVVACATHLHYEGDEDGDKDGDGKKWFE